MQSLHVASQNDDTTVNQLLHAFEGENDIHLPETCSLREILHSIAHKTPQIASLVLDRSLNNELKQESRKYFRSELLSIGVSSFCYVRQPGAFHNWLLIYVTHHHTITSRPRSNQGSHRNPLGMGGQQTMSQISL